MACQGDREYGSSPLGAGNEGVHGLRECKSHDDAGQSTFHDHRAPVDLNSVSNK